jgi:hypothetical protein
MAPVRVYALVRLYLPPSSETFKVKGGIQVLPYELVCLFPRLSIFALTFPQAADPRYASSPRLTALQSLGLGEDLQLTFSQFSDAFAFTAIGTCFSDRKPFNF